MKLLCGSFYSLSMILYIAIVVYTPALALEQVLGLNVDLSCAAIFIGTNIHYQQLFTGLLQIKKRHNIFQNKFSPRWNIII